MCFPRQTLFSKRCLDPCHSQQIVSQGEDCVFDVNISSSLKRSSKWISHVSRSRARVSYYCNSVATFHPIIKVIYDIERNPGPAQVSVNNKCPPSLDEAHMGHQSLPTKATQHKPWIIHFKFSRRYDLERSYEAIWLQVEVHHKGNSYIQKLFKKLY